MNRSDIQQRIVCADARQAILGLKENSVDSIVTDGPYEIYFQGHDWDNTGITFDPRFWAECLRVLMPGGYLLSFCAARTYHRMACAIEDAGFEIRSQIDNWYDGDKDLAAFVATLDADQLELFQPLISQQGDTGFMDWLYGQGSPKDQDVDKRIDKFLGAERKVLGYSDRRGKFDGRVRTSCAINTNWRTREGRTDVRDVAYKEISLPATSEAEKWKGWNTMLKPAHNPICVARKPLSEKNVAADILRWGVGPSTSTLAASPSHRIRKPRVGTLPM